MLMHQDRKYGKNWLGELAGDEGHVESEVLVEFASRAV